MGGTKIIDVKVVGLCSKCRTDKDEIPKDKFGKAYLDKDIACFSCAFGEKSQNEAKVVK